jgi:hypothetical protein
MAKVDPQALSERLFSTFLAPLVLGGPLRPVKAIGGRAALSIGEHRVPADIDALSRTQLARVRVARALAPIDTLAPAPGADEWTLAAMLHDIVHATHPDFDAVLRRRAPMRILEIVEATLERVPAPRTIGDTLSRHTWFSRMFKLARTDVEVRWWTGSQTFLGTEPPARLLAWPELRRVQEIRTAHPLMELPSASGAADAHRFGQTVEAFLAKTPLTDLASIDRESPPFAWTRENLSFSSTQAGRTTTLRAFALLPTRKVDAALGRATRRLFVARATRALGHAIDLLRERVLQLAAARLGHEREAPPLTLGGSAEEDDAAFALAAGALAATHWIGQTGGGFEEGERRALLGVLAPAASSAAAGELRALMPG